MSAASYEGFRVFIAGSCQVTGMRHWVGEFLPGSKVAGWHINASPDWTPEKIAPQIEDADLVITQFNSADFGPVTFDALKLRHAKVVLLPILVFPGFHPDLGFSPAGKGQPGFLRGPLDVMQSKIAMASYHLGLPAERVPALFNALTFHALGYFDAFEASRTPLIKIFGESGYDLSGSIQSWLREGCFMYTDNHPHIRVLRTLTRIALEKVGLSVHDVPVDRPAADSLANACVWPVYPSMARRIGVAGSTEFMRPLHGRSESERAMTLDAFVDESYRVMRDAYGSDSPFYPQTLQIAKILESLLQTRGLAAA